MVAFPGFVGGSGQMRSPNVNAEQCINFYPEIADAGTPKARTWLRPVPGLAETYVLTGARNHCVGLATIEERGFAVAGMGFYELFPGPNGVNVLRGSLVADAGTTAAQIVSNGIGRQVLIVAGGKGYIFNLDTLVFAQIADPQFPNPVIWGGFADGYYVAVGVNKTQFSFSTLSDGTAWAALDISVKSKTTDAIVAAVFDHGELLLFGTQTTEAYFNTGDARYPWTPRPVPLETGILAPASLAKGKESIFYIQGSERGPATIVAAAGFNAVPIGSASVHQALRSSEHPELARAWFYEDGEHGFYVLSFDDQTWVYDTLTKVWHERLFWNTGTGSYLSHQGLCHTYVFGKHLVGLRGLNPYFGFGQDDALVAEMNDRFPYYVRTTESPTFPAWTIRRVRRCPYVHGGGRMVFHDRLELDMDTGLAVNALDGPDDVDSPLHHFISMRYSDDNGKTWSHERRAQLGADGEYGRRVFWNSLGRSRSRIYEIIVDGGTFARPVVLGIAGADLQVRVGLQ